MIAARKVDSLLAEVERQSGALVVERNLGGGVYGLNMVAEMGLIPFATITEDGSCFRVDGRKRRMRPKTTAAVLVEELKKEHKKSAAAATVTRRQIYPMTRKDYIQ